MLQAVALETAICRVEVFRNSALVTRRGRLAASAGPVTVRIGGLPLGLEEESVRAWLLPAGAGRVLSLHLELELGPGEGSLRSQAEEELHRIERQRAELCLKQFHLQHRLRWAESLRPVDVVERRLPRALAFGPRPVVEPRLQLAAWVREEQLRLGDALLGLERERRELDDRLAQARDRLERESAAERERLRSLRRAVRLTLQPAVGRQDLEVAVSYQVRGVAWHPQYQVRVFPAQGSAELVLGATVAQSTGEDWPRCELIFCTADLERSCELPELPSWRIGRPQPPRPSGWRPLPEGLDALFASYDSARKESPVETQATAASLPPTPPPPGLEELAEPEAMAHPDMQEPQDAEEQEVALYGTAKPQPAAPPASAFREYALKRRRMAPADADLEGATLATAQAPAGVADETDEVTGEIRLPGGPQAAPRALAFESLRLCGPQESDRGRLRRQTPGEAAVLLSAEDYKTMESLAAALAGPATPYLPFGLSGHFAVRYPAEGPGDIPADGQPHQIVLMQKETPVQRFFACVPAADTRVYQQAELANPFGVALLDGPLRVYQEGDFLAESLLETTAPGKPIRVNLGVAEAIAVARNVHFEEGTAGLMGGTTVLRHRLEITVHSKLPHPIRLLLFERLPVSDTPELEVRLLRAQPPAEPYDQADRGLMVRGGLRFTLELAAREKKTCLLEYQIQLPQKYILEGGNRRE